MEDKQKTLEVKEESKGQRPAYRILQAVMENGEEKLLEVGACWAHKAKSGQPYLQARIGNLRLLIFPNTPKPQQQNDVAQFM
jgi:uncharacterized protein (DUF736 family)